MKIAILGDTHFGMRGDSVAFHNLNRRFYEEVFFPYLKENNIYTVIDLGDTFDRRKYISYYSLSRAKKYWFDPIKENRINPKIIKPNLFTASPKANKTKHLLLFQFFQTGKVNNPEKKNKKLERNQILNALASEKERAAEGGEEV